MSKARRSSFFSPVSTRTASGAYSTATASRSELEVSRITKKSYIKIQSTSTGCYCTLFLLVGVPDTADPQTPFPLLADRHIDLREWHIHSLDAHWAAPALSESAARAAAIFKIPVSTDLALDESEPTNTAVVVSTGGNLNLIVPAGSAPVPDAMTLGGGAAAHHAEHGKRGYLITLSIEIDHIRNAPEWPLQVTIPVPRCLMNTFEFRISSSDHLSAKDSPIRIYPKLIGSTLDDTQDSPPASTTHDAAEATASATSGAGAAASSIRRCSIVYGPKVKGIFTATSYLTLVWLRGSDAAHAAVLAAYSPKLPILQPLQVTRAQSDTTWTSLSHSNEFGCDHEKQARAVTFETTCTLSGLTYLGIDERSFVKFELVAQHENVVLSEVKLAASSGKTGSSKGILGVRTRPKPRARIDDEVSSDGHGLARRPASVTSRIPSLRGPASSAPQSGRSNPKNAHNRSSSLGGLLPAGMDIDTTMLDDNGDLMAVAPPKGLFNHDLSFSVDHQAFLDESAIADLSSMDRIKQMASGPTGAAAFANAHDTPNANGADSHPTSSANEDLPQDTLNSQNCVAVLIDVDEALGVLPSRLKDTITFRLEGTAIIDNLVDSTGAATLPMIEFSAPAALTCRSRSIVSPQLQEAVDAQLAHAKKAEKERAKVESAAKEAHFRYAQMTSGDATPTNPFASGRQSNVRNLSSESIQTPIKHSIALGAELDPLATPTRQSSQRSRAAPSRDAGDMTINLAREVHESSPPPQVSQPKPRSPQLDSSADSVTSARKSSTSTRSTADLPGLASPINAPLDPNLARALRKRAASDDRSGFVGSGPNAGEPRMPSSPPQLNVPRMSYGSDESVGSMGSGQKRADWQASAGASTSSSSAGANNRSAPFGAHAAVGPAAADWTVQDLSASMVGDQSLSHGTLPYTVHNALVEIVPTLRRSSAAQDPSNGSKGPVEEVRLVRKLICPTWPRAELDGRLVLVPSVTLLMRDSEEVVSVWCEHGRLKWVQLSKEEMSVLPEATKKTTTDADVVAVRVELPASLRNYSSGAGGSGRSGADQCKLEVRIASAWSVDDAARLRRGEAVEVDVPVLDCAVGTFDLHFCKPSDAWPRPAAFVDGFRTQRPTDVKAYLTQDDVHGGQPLQARLRYGPERSSALVFHEMEVSRKLLWAAIVALLAMVIFAMLVSSPSTHRLPLPGFPGHVEALARQATTHSQHETLVPGSNGSAGKGHGSHTSPFEPRPTSQQQVDSAASEADGPLAQPTKDGAQTAEPESVHRKDVFGDEDEDDGHDDDADAAEYDDRTAAHHSLASPDQHLPALWQRMLDSLFGLFKWIRAT
ncbi:hypothetical protein OC844_002346 [Tilletia horrida]|nr:hypothetical protein OC844_002346 [Tilletia horrida]